MERHRTSTGFGEKITDMKERAGEFTKSRLARQMLQFVTGFALSFAAMGSGIAPFGLSYAAMCREGGIFAAAGAFFGYTLAYGSGGLIYAAAVIICFACGVVFRGTRAAQNPYIMPLCVFASLMCVKSVSALQQGGLGGILILFCESVLGAGFCLLFDSAFYDVKAPVRTASVWGKLAVLVAALLVFQPIRVLGDISPARIVAAFAIMCIACFCGSAMGAGAGAAVGACMDLASGGTPFFAAAYSFAGLLGGLGGRQGRFVCTMCYVLANCVATMWNHSHNQAVPGLFECFVASVIFVMLPDEAFQRLNLSFLQSDAPVIRASGQKAFEAGRLQAVSQAIGELGTAMNSFVLGLRRENGDITKVFDRAADKICRRCPTASLCWEKDYMSTHTVLNDITHPLRQKNFIRAEDFPGHFSARCTHINQLCGAINEEYRSFLRRLAAARKDEETRALMGKQYQSLQGIISDMAGSAGMYPEYYPALEARVRAVAKAYCRPSRVTVCRQAGRMHVEMTLLGEDNVVNDEDAFIKSLSLALGTSFWPPVAMPAKNGRILRISQRERLRAIVNYAVRKKQGEETCGDTSGHLRTDDGRAVVMLSDGMGTGNAAGAMSAKALELITGFVKSGCSLAESTRAVIPVLNARFEDCGFVTLDLLEINLFSGDSGLLKYGAAPSYVVRGGRAEKICGNSLPAGLAPGADGPQPIGFRLDAGDRVVMMSDGVWDNSDTEKIIESSLDEPASALGGSLIEMSGKAGAVDDMSVLVISIQES